MNENIKKFLSVILVFLLSVSVIPRNCFAAEDEKSVTSLPASDATEITIPDFKQWSGIKESKKSVTLSSEASETPSPTPSVTPSPASNATEVALPYRNTPSIFKQIYKEIYNWLPEIYKGKIKPWFSDLLKSDEQVNNTFVSLLYHFGKRSVINIGKGSAKFVAWAWKTLFRTPGALAEWLGGYKSNKIADKSSEIKELQRIIDLCNKNKTCKAVLSDILKNAEKN